MRAYHDSNDTKYRLPLGSAPCNTKVTLRIKCYEKCLRVYARLWWQNEERLVEAAAADGSEAGLYEAEIELPDTPGVLWYFFIIDTDAGRFFYGNALDNLDGVGETRDTEPAGYQITVFDPAFKAPLWMRDSVIYQIMTDRFFASKPLEERTKPHSGWLHKDWYEPVALCEGEACDFFGGDLRGIEEKLGYLKSIGVGAIYLNPIFRARSNHKYDTGDYRQIDPSFGTESDFTSLCDKAKEMGIRVMLDGVFSHTGSASRYFNQDGSFQSVGACQSKDSPYFGWYRFKNWPDDYECWWGFRTMPNVDEMNPDYLDFIIGSEDSVSAHWLKKGASGWRLDVADELPMQFIRLMRRRVKSVDRDCALLGEVWEDASNKNAYGEMRCYCLGDTLDSVMNYPLRDIAIGFMLGDIDSVQFTRRYNHQKNAYAPEFFFSLMNLLGSHDKPRIIDVLSGDIDIEPSREHRRFRVLPPEKYLLGCERYVSLWRFICSLPGMPCVYYADEAGQTGMADPFCRATYPWGRENTAVLDRISRINNERNSLEVLRRGEVRLYAPDPQVIVCARFIKNGVDALGMAADDALCVCALNRSDREITVTVAPDDVLPSGFTTTVGARSSKTLVVE